MAVASSKAKAPANVDDTAAAAAVVAAGAERATPEAISTASHHQSVVYRGATQRKHDRPIRQGGWEAPPLAPVVQPALSSSHMIFHMKMVFLSGL